MSSPTPNKKARRGKIDPWWWGLGVGFAFYMVAGGLWLAIVMLRSGYDEYEHRVQASLAAIALAVYLLIGITRGPVGDAIGSRLSAAWQQVRMRWRQNPWKHAAGFTLLTYTLVLSAWHVANPRLPVEYQIGQDQIVWMLQHTFLPTFLFAVAVLQSYRLSLRSGNEELECDPYKWTIGIVSLRRIFSDLGGILHSAGLAEEKAREAISRLGGGSGAAAHLGLSSAYGSDVHGRETLGSWKMLTLERRLNWWRQYEERNGRGKLSVVELSPAQTERPYIEIECVHQYGLLHTPGGEEYAWYWYGYCHALLDGLLLEDNGKLNPWSGYRISRSRNSVERSIEFDRPGKNSRRLILTFYVSPEGL